MTFLSTIAHDLRYAVRMIGKSPAFSLVTIATLALGIGANTAIVSVVDNLFFRPPPFHDVDRLVSIFETNPEKVPPDAEPPPSPGNVLDWRERSRSFDAIAMWRNWYYAVQSAGASSAAPESVRGVRVSPVFFRMLGVDAALGRTFSDQEAIPGRDSVVVLSQRLWTRRFGGDPSLVGRSVTLNGESYTIVGLAPPALAVLTGGDIWTPMTIDPGRENRLNHVITVVGRLRPGVSVAQADVNLRLVAEELRREMPSAMAKDESVTVLPYRDATVKGTRPALLLLMG
ncbi:MAG TPA: ABC transporter permease, partial [Vicinamibacterales bacterium]|nr:ABC transporter permease [Vicinamibacterales bacterium]